MGRLPCPPGGGRPRAGRRGGRGRPLQGGTYPSPPGGPGAGGGGTLLVSCPEPSETLMEPVPFPPPQVLLTAGSKFPGG